jgi:hypothetical protein
VDANSKAGEGAEQSQRHSGLKTAKVLGLFMAITLVATAGCGTAERDQLQHVHYDKNGDGYCDEDGAPMNSSVGRSGFFHGGGFYSLPHFGGAESASSPSPSHPAGISSGTAGHGGIGAVSAGGGG